MDKKIIECQSYLLKAQRLLDDMSRHYQLIESQGHERYICSRLEQALKLTEGLDESGTVGETTST